MHSLIGRFSKYQQGMSAIEFAIVLPVAALILMGVVEFGLTMLKGQSLQRSLAGAASSVQASPQNLAIVDLANSNTSLIDFDSDGNFICAAPYETLAQAEAGDCNAGQWNTLPPNQDVTSYFILMKGHVANAAITGLMTPFIGNLSDKQIIGVEVTAEIVEETCPDGHEVIANEDGTFDCEEPICRSGFVVARQGDPSRGVAYHGYTQYGGSFCNHASGAAGSCGSTPTVCCPENARRLVNTGCSSENSHGSCTQTAWQCRP